MDNTVKNNKNISYTNLYSGLAGEIYKKISKTSTNNEMENDYVMVLFSFTRLVNQLIKEEIPKKLFHGCNKSHCYDADISFCYATYEISKRGKG